MTVPSPQYGTFMMGYEENVPRIEMPQTADLADVTAQAAQGGTAFTGDSNGAYGQASTRIEFVAIDLNNDGDVTDDNEGFFKVYQSTNEAWVVGTTDGDLTNNQNCGALYNGTFVAAGDGEWERIEPGTPFVLVPGMQARVGRQEFVFDSHHRRVEHDNLDLE